MFWLLPKEYSLFKCFRLDREVTRPCSEVVEGDGGIFGYPVDKTGFFAVNASGFGARKQQNPVEVSSTIFLRSVAVRIDSGSVSNSTRFRFAAGASAPPGKDDDRPEDGGEMPKRR